MKTISRLGMAIILACASSMSLAADSKDAWASFHSALVRGDKDAAASLLAPDVTIYESGYVERSRAEYVSHHLAEDIAFAKSTTRKVLKQEERDGGAIIWQETETTGRFHGKAIHSYGTETAILEKSGESWTIVHIHWSSRKAK